jgi:hypothetical protein
LVNVANQADVDAFKRLLEQRDHAWTARVIPVEACPEFQRTFGQFKT